jgi:hypothetical protein
MDWLRHLLNPELIRAAASSPLGVLSLMCILIAVIAIIFFRNSSENIRLIAFVFMLAGVVGFGISISTQQPESPSPAVLSPLTPGYDFIEKASTAKWSNGSDSLSFPGNRDDTKGFVYFGSYEVLADGTVSPRFLEMHPQWTYHGLIEGKYGSFQIANDLKFHGQVGFLKTASGSDGVNFKIEYLPLSSDRDRQILKEKYISFDPKNPKIKPLSDNSDNSVDLSLLNNSKGYIILSVDAGQNSGRDHAVWVEARVTR